MAEHSKKPKIVVLRWGHRYRDQRVTTHVALVARALGVSHFILADSRDDTIKATIDKITASWGGKFSFEMGNSWKKTVEEWRGKGGVVVHLTVYGENIQTSKVLQNIRDSKRDILIIVGSQKVPKEFFSSDVSDFNVAIGNQPHSEVSSLAVFLDRFYEGNELGAGFNQAKLRIIPQKRGKKVVES